MTHHDPAHRAARVVARDLINQHEQKKNKLRYLADVDVLDATAGDALIFDGHLWRASPVDETQRTLLFTKSGALTVGASTVAYHPTFSFGIVGVRGNVSANASSDVIFDVLNNGVSIFDPIEVPKPMIPAGLSYGFAQEPSEGSVAENDKLLVSIISTGGASNLVVSIDLLRL